MLVAVVTGLGEGSRVGEVLYAAGRGAVGAMAMTGMRVLTTELGLLEQTPPDAVSRQRARGVRALLRRAPRRQRRGLVEAAHWAFGAGGAAFEALPPTVRRRPWAGPMYGLVVWLGFEMGSRRPWASGRPSACARSTASRWSPTTCSTAWCYRSRTEPREARPRPGPPTQRGAPGSYAVGLTLRTAQARIKNWYLHLNDCRGSGVEMIQPITGVFTFRDGKVAVARYYIDRGEALQAVGLRE